MSAFERYMTETVGRIDARVEKIDAAVRGDGTSDNVGLIADVRELKRERQRRHNRATWYVRTFLGALITTAVGVLAYLAFGVS